MCFRTMTYRQKFDRSSPTGLPRAVHRVITTKQKFEKLTPPNSGREEVECVFNPHPLDISVQNIGDGELSNFCDGSPYALESWRIQSTRFTGGLAHPPYTTTLIPSKFTGGDHLKFHTTHTPQGFSK